MWQRTIFVSCELTSNSSPGIYLPYTSHQALEQDPMRKVMTRETHTLNRPSNEFRRMHKPFCDTSELHM